MPPEVTREQLLKDLVEKQQAAIDAHETVRAATEQQIVALKNEVAAERRLAHVNDNLINELMAGSEIKQKLIDAQREMLDLYAKDINPESSAQGTIIENLTRLTLENQQARKKAEILVEQQKVAIDNLRQKIDTHSREDREHKFSGKKKAPR